MSPSETNLFPRATVPSPASSPTWLSACLCTSWYSSGPAVAPSNAKAGDQSNQPQAQWRKKPKTQSRRGGLCGDGGRSLPTLRSRLVTNLPQSKLVSLSLVHPGKGCARLSNRGLKPPLWSAISSARTSGDAALRANGSSNSAARWLLCH